MTTDVSLSQKTAWEEQLCGRWVPKQLADAAILGSVKKFKKENKKHALWVGHLDALVGIEILVSAEF